MFAATEYAVSLTYTCLLAILRKTLEKKKILCTRQFLDKKTDHVLAAHSGETEEETSMVLKSNLHMHLKTFLKIQNARKTEHEICYVERCRIFHT